MSNRKDNYERFNSWLVVETIKIYATEEKPISVKEISFYLKENMGIEIDLTTIRRILANCKDVMLYIKSSRTSEISNYLGDELYVYYKVEERFILIETEEELEQLVEKKKALYYFVNDIYGLTEEEREMIAGMIKSYPYISEDETEDLLDKLGKSFNTSFDASNYNHTYAPKLDHLPLQVQKSVDIYNNCRILQNCIEEKRPIKVTNSSYVIEKGQLILKEKKPYIVHPYMILWEKGSCYLVGLHDKYDNLISLRVDRILDVDDMVEEITYKVIPEEYERIYSDKSRQKISIRKFKKMAPYMFTNPVKPIKIQCKDYICNVVLDVFGFDIKIEEGPEEDTFIFSTQCDIAGAERFVLQQCDSVVVLEPQELRERIKNKMATSLRQY